MPATIDYYYVGSSPFTFLGHKALSQTAKKHEAAIQLKPVDIFALWEQSGAVPPAKRPPVRQRYRLLELQRISDMRGIPINLKPKHFPADFELADRCAIAIKETGGDAYEYAGAIGRGVWQDDADISDEDEISKRLTETGHDAAAILKAAKGDTVAAIREQNTKDALAVDAIGVPAYVLNGEVFWGQDRIDFLDHALTTGRPAFTANV